MGASGGVCGKEKGDGELLVAGGATGQTELPVYIYKVVRASVCRLVTQERV